jgi:hypothetical protein
MKPWRWRVNSTDRRTLTCVIERDSADKIEQNWNFDNAPAKSFESQRSA